MTKPLGLLGIGSALVDILAHKDTAFLAEHGFVKGAMTLIDEATATKLYAALGTAAECSGGATANTVAGFAMLGGKAAFVGRVKKDALGTSFKQSLEQTGAMFAAKPAEAGSPTGNCTVIVTEDGGVERTMATFLGAASELSPEDIDEQLVKDARILFFEGYSWDSPSAREAVKKAIAIAKPAGTKVAFSLSDPLCVGRHKADFLDLIDNDCDILFANEHEIEALLGCNSVDEVMEAAKGRVETLVITCSERGSYIITNNKAHRIAPVSVPRILDVTGAGDSYAAGVLYGFAHGFSPDKAGALGSACAAEVIQHLGARPLRDLKELVA